MSFMFKHILSIHVYHLHSEYSILSPSVDLCVSDSEWMCNACTLNLKGIISTISIHLKNSRRATETVWV